MALTEGEFHNPYRLRYRVMLYFGCVCLIAAGLGGLLLASGKVDAQTASGTAVAVSTILGFVGAVAMFVLALVISFVARATDRTFDQFARGDLLADWRFPPGEWDAFLETERARLGNANWAASLFVACPVALVFAIVAWSVASNTVTRVLGVGGAIAGILALACLLTLLTTKSSRRHLAGLRRNPRVLIGKDAIYFGGILTQWDYGGTLLQRVRLIEGTPLKLEVTTGAGPVPIKGAFDFMSVLLIPVPLGKEDEAATVLSVLTQR